MKPLKRSNILLLLLGRFSFRGINTLSTVLLLAIWGSHVFGSYASLLGTWLFLNPFVTWGLEKAALKLLPRTRSVQPYLLTTFLALSTLLAAPFVAGFLLYLALDHSEIVALSSVLALLSIAQGINQTLVGYNRAIDKLMLDFINFTAFALFMLLGIILAYLYAITPLMFSLYLLSGVCCLNLLLICSLARQSRFHLSLLRRKKLASYSLRTAFFMGFNNIVGSASISVLFFVLSFYHLETQSSYLYIGVSIFNLAFAFGEYIMRICQTRVTVFLKRQRLEIVQQHILRRLQTFVLFAPLYLMALFLLVKILDAVLQNPILHIPGYTLSVGFLLLSAPIFFMTELISYVLENLNSRSLVMTSSGAFTAFLTAASLSWCFIPLFGCLGAILALSAGEIAHSIIVFFWIRRKGAFFYAR